VAAGVVTIRDYAAIIANGQCSARCLRAQNPRCDGCACQGRLHGVLAGVDVCTHGHPLFAGSFTILASGRRCCVECNRRHGRESMRRWRERQRRAGRR
jgi:hypothetical protein